MDILGIGRAHRRATKDTPVAVFSRSFPIVTALSDLWAFLRDSLGRASLTTDELMGIDAIVADALTEVDECTKALIVSLRVFPHSIEVEVLLSDTLVDSSGQTRFTYGSSHVGRRQQPSMQDS